MTNHFISNLSALGDEFRKASLEDIPGAIDDLQEGSVLANAGESACLQNSWFSRAFVKNSFSAWAVALEQKKVREWTLKYGPGFEKMKKPSTIGLIMAGNIPIVGLHDLLCVYASGHNAIIKLSSNDKVLIPAVLEVLSLRDPGIKNRFRIAEGPLKDFDAVIATGSNNASRYFEYYFSKYPYIIRKNRNGVAVITGSESDDELRNLADDIFMYYGLGCRSISKVYLPEGYKAENLFPFFSHYEFLADQHKYMNNYDYQKSILLINRVPHLDNGFLLVKPDSSLVSPVSVLNTGIYPSFGSLKTELELLKDQIQCIVSSSKDLDDTVPFGKSQFPELWDYADGLDTMEFLLNL